MTRSFFRCLSCGHITPYRAGGRGIVAHNNRAHDGHARFEQAEPAPGHAILKRRYGDSWKDVDLTRATIDVEWGRIIRAIPGTWSLVIEPADGSYFLHGEWRSQRTAENKRLELRKIGRTGR